jgi:hypothetical protein
MSEYSTRMTGARTGGEGLGLGLAVASLTLGILWIFGVGSVLAVAFALAARDCSPHRGGVTRGLRIAGLILGLVGILAIAVTVLSFSGSALSGGG